MTKKEVCLENKPFASYGISNCLALAIHHIEYGIDNYIYFTTSGVSTPTYHKSKIRFNHDGRDYFTYGKMKVYLDECINL